MKTRFRTLPRAAQGFTLVLSTICLALVVLAYPSSHLPVATGLAAIFAACTLVKPVPNPVGGRIFPTTSVKLVVALLWLPQDALIGVAVGSFLGLVLFQRAEVWRAANNGAGWGLAVGSATLTAHLAEGAMPPGVLQLTVAGILTMVVHRVINEGIFAVDKSLRFRLPFISTWREEVVNQWMSNVLAVPMGIVLAAVATRIGNVWSSLALTALSAVALPIPRQELAYYHRAQQAVGEIVEAVVRALEGVVKGARAHGDRVSALAGKVGARLRMSEEYLRSLRLAGRLHDVGFLAGPDGDTPHSHHAAAGSRILAEAPDPRIARMVRAHHERWDGSGLPDGARGKAIPLGGRVLAAVETYDEIRFGSTDGVARKSEADALADLLALAGTALDPRVVNALAGVLKEQERDETNAP